MNTQLTLIRHDDFDFRLSPKEYIAIHEQFIQAGLVETAVLQFTHDNRLVNIPQEIIDYMNKAPNWEFAIHGWDHAHYDEFLTDVVVRDIAAAMHFCEELFHKRPTLWCTPWNCNSLTMEAAARILGVKIDNESFDIARFIREVKANVYSGHSFYFHGWKADEMLQMAEAVACAKEVSIWTTTRVDPVTA